MAAIPSPSWITNYKLLGDTPNADPGGVLFRAKNISTGLQAIALDQHIEIPASTFVLNFQPTSAPNASAVDSPAFIAPFPFQIGEVQASCVTAAGTAATADLQVGASVAAAASVLAAAIDIKTNLVTPQVTTPDKDKDLVEAGEFVQAVFTGTGAGALAGANLWAVCKRV